MIELLKPISETEANSLIKIKVSSENIDEAYKQYSNGILDVFNRQLSFDEASELLSSFIEHNLKYEHRYIEFIKRVYELNKNNPIIAEVYLGNLESIDIVRIIEVLDFKDKLLFIDLIRHNSTKSNLFLVTSEEGILLLTKLSTRELLFTTFHFTSIPISIIGNFELSFPTFFKSEEEHKIYKDIARKNHLYFRSSSN
jgi:hypothetical protein